MAIKGGIMKVYVVVEYRDKVCSLIDVYSTRSGSEKKAIRMEKDPVNRHRTYHVLCKSVKGLSDIKYKEENGKRYIDVKRNNKRKTK